MPFIAIALLVAAALGGGVSVAANSALPGDALWGFKTSVNENIQGALTADTKAKADWDISVLSARLDEASKLAAEGKLDANAQAKLSANFDEHAKDVAAKVAALQADGKTSEAADVATRFQATLASHASAVAEASAKDSTEAQATAAPFLAQIRGTLDAAANLSASASAKAELRGANSDGNASATGTANANEESNLNGTSTGVSGSGHASGGLRVNTGDSASSSLNSDGSVKVNVY